MVGKYEEVRDALEKREEREQQENETKQFLIDRRLINNQLVQYCSPKTSYTAKTQILVAMATMLHFTD